MRRGRENGTARLVWAFEWVPAINKSRDFTLWNFISTRDDRADVCFMLVPDSVRAALKWVYSIQTVCVYVFDSKVSSSQHSRSILLLNMCKHHR